MWRFYDRYGQERPVSIGVASALTLVDDLRVGVSGIAAYDTLARLGGNIPQTYKHLRLVIDARGDTAATAVGCILTANGDTGSNYERELVTFSGATVAASGQDATTPLNIAGGNDFPAANATVGQFGAMVIDIPNYTGTTGWKSFLARGASHYAPGNRISYRSDIVWRSAAAITRLQLATNAGLYVSESRFTLYGVN